MEVVPLLLIVLLGIGFFFPIATLAQAIDFWDDVFSGYDFEFVMLSIYTSIKLVIVFFLVFFTVKRPNFDLFISNGLFGSAVAMIVIPSFYYANLSTHSYYAVTLSAVAVAAVSAALLDSTMFAFVANYPGYIQEGLQLGIGMSYFIASLFRVITKASFLSSIVEATIIYFYIAGMFVLTCIILHQYFLSLPISKDTVDRLRNSLARLARLSDTVSESQPLVGSLDDVDVTEISFEPPEDKGEERSCCQDLALVFNSKLPVLRTVWFNELMLCLTMILNIFIFPGMVSLLVSYNYPHLNENDWWPVIMEITYTFCDLSGRLCCHFRGSITSENIWIPVCSRIIFIPLFLCSVYGFLFTNDIWTVMFVILAAFSSGYVTPILIMTITDDVAPHERLVVGMFSGFFLNLGSMLGSLAALKFTL